MNNNVLITGAGLAGGALGTAAALGTVKVANKITGKPVGIYGSTAHVLTNDKVEDKFSCYKDQTVQGLKDTAKLGAAATVAGAAAAGLSAVSNKLPKVQTLVSEVKNEVSNLLSKVSISGKGSLKDIITNTKAYQKINGLPTPVKAAALGAIALLSVALPIFATKTAADSAAIEAKHEAANRTCGCVA